jgi:hypothetical protein
MATYNLKILEDIVGQYTAGQQYLQDVDIDITPEENKIDPLEALRMFQGERSIDNGLKLATLFCVNKTVTFTKGAKSLVAFTPVVGKPIQDYLIDYPYLLDVLCSAVWGILLKKLTPPSIGSASVDG